MMAIKWNALTAGLNPWLAWLLWLFVLATGLYIAGEFFHQSIGPPDTIAWLLSYPFYLIAFRREQYAAIQLTAALLHFWLLITMWGVPMPNSGWLIVLVIAVTIVCPIMIANIFPVAADKTALMPISVIAWLIFALLILMSPVIIIGLSISTAEFMQANAFREFCKRELEGMSASEMEQRVPARFVSARTATSVEISSHGRGCIATITGGRMHVEALLPSTGFSWMLAAPEGTELKGAFE